MLIQVTTTHGKPFWCANIRFGPQPTRLWLGDGRPRDASLERVTSEQLARMEQFTGDHGPLFIEKDPIRITTGERDEQFDKLREELGRAERRAAELREQLDAATRRADELVERNENMAGKLAGFEALLAEERERTTAAEKRAAEAGRKSKGGRKS